MRKGIAAVLATGAASALAMGGAQLAGAFTPTTCGSTGVLSGSGATYTCTYATAGEDTFTVPAGVSSVSVVAVGAPGGDGGEYSGNGGGAAGGSGAQVSAPAVAVTPGQTLYAEVGGAGANGAGDADCAAGSGGFNGGAQGGDATCEAGGGGGGGGASDLRTEPAADGGLTADASDPRLVVAGGGGGGAGADGSLAATAGGAAGDTTVTGAGAGAVIDCTALSQPAGSDGGAGAGGGAAGTSSDPGDCSNGEADGAPGSPGAGGDGGGGASQEVGGAGGGGGGYTGGGGGAVATGYVGGGIGGGGAGSSFGPAGTSFAIAGASATPEVAISWTYGSPSATITTPAQGAVYQAGSVLDSSFSCADGTGPGVQSCLDSGGNASGAQISTTSTGLQTYAVTATSLDGLSSQQSVSYRVAFPPAVAITTPAAGTVYAQGAPVDSDFGCTDGAGGTGIATCADQGGNASGAAIDTSDLGSHTYAVTATSADGLSAVQTVSYSVADPPTASITAPAANAVYALGSSVHASFSCADGTDGTGITTCTDQNGAGSGDSIPTGTVGRQSFTVTATSADGLTSSAVVSYTVVDPPPVVTAAPGIIGSAASGAVLLCSSGSWAGGAASLSYQWNRDGTPLAGASSPTYTVAALDEGTTLTCTVTASNVGGTVSSTSPGVTVPVPVVAHCPAATGDLSGATLGAIHLGMTRAQARRAYRSSSNRGQAYQDFFCLTPIGIRVGYASPRLLASLPRAQRASVRGRVVWASTANPSYAIAQIRPGASLVNARARLKLGPVLRIGLNDWYLARTAGVTAVLKVRDDIVQEIGIAVADLTASRREQRVFMTSFQ